MHPANLNDWRIAAALAYHLPGAGLLVHDGGNLERHIAPTTSLIADMHPGELRDLLGGFPDSVALDAIRAELGIDRSVTVFAELLPTSPILRDCGLGLFQIGTAMSGGAFVFATLLDANDAATALRDAMTYPTAEPARITNAGLGFDETLRVTLAVFEWAPGSDDEDLARIERHVRAAQASCGVAELLARTTTADH